MIMGIFAVVLGACVYEIGLLFAALAIIFGIVGIIVRGGRGMAVAGLLLGVFGVIGVYIWGDLTTGERRSFKELQDFFNCLWILR